MNYTDLKYRFNSEIICPHCDGVQTDSWKYQESMHIDCDHCDKEFYVEVDVEITYSSSK